MPECKYCGKDWSENIISIHESRCDAQDEVEKPSLEEEVKEYHTGGGYYDIPGIEDKVHGKEAALKVLREGENEW